MQFSVGLPKTMCKCNRSNSTCTTMCLSFIIFILELYICCCAHSTSARWIWIKIKYTFSKFQWNGSQPSSVGSSPSLLSIILDSQINTLQHILFIVSFDANILSGVRSLCSLNTQIGKTKCLKHWWLGKWIKWLTHLH